MCADAKFSQLDYRGIKLIKINLILYITFFFKLFSYSIIMVLPFSTSIFSDYIYYLIPFIFTFALVFGVLTISNVFKNQKNVNAILALAITLFSILYPPYIKILYNWLPYLCILFILLFVVLMLRNLFVESEKKLQQSWPMLITIAILFLIFISFAPSITLPSSSLISFQDILLLIGIAFVVILLVSGAAMGNKGFDSKYSE